MDFIQKYIHLKSQEDHPHYDLYQDCDNVAQSTRIEGSTLYKYDVISFIQRGKREVDKDPIHYLMVEDCFDSLRKIKNTKDTKLTSRLISEINSSVMKSTGGIKNTAAGSVDIAKGEYRKSSVSAGNRYFTDYQKIPGKVDQYCEEINTLLPSQKTIVDQLRLSFKAHFDLVTIHPFYDGNGRTSRLVMNFIQQLYSLPLAIVLAQDKERYYNSLNISREQGSLEPFYDFMFEQYEDQLTTEINYFKHTQNAYSS